MLGRYPDRQLSLARQLRRDMTTAEAMLWRALRDRGLGAKFRRQVPVGAYIADFACVRSKLIIELDGPPHEDPDQRRHDAQRDAWLRSQGWCVMRFSNDVVIGGGNLVLQEISRVIAALAGKP